MSMPDHASKNSKIEEEIHSQLMEARQSMRNLLDEIVEAP